MRVTFWKDGIEPLHKQGGKIDDGKQRLPNSNPILAPYGNVALGRNVTFQSLSPYLSWPKSIPSFALQDAGRPYKTCQLHEKSQCRKSPCPPQWLIPKAALSPLDRQSPLLVLI